jgi:ATP-dependent DNA helicase RecQ
MARSLDRLARDAFGYKRLRPEQRRAIEAVVGGRDTLVVMPTGSGKSAIYQVAGLAVDGPTVVVSPLIALQRDQLEALEEAHAGRAAALNSRLRVRERRETFEALEHDALEYLFLAPEQLANDEVLGEVAAAEPSLLVVDEAHCISEWGHDFRPDYLRLGAVAEALGRPTVLALTATASPPVRAEIVERLGLRDPLVVIHGFDRPNIWLGVELFLDEDAKRDALVARLAEEPKPGIVYAATRARAEALAETLRERGVDARAYHGGMATADRDAVQAAFMNDELETIVATTAFGMGIDKPNVRFVHHLDVSDSVDSYYQEIGRAGRDGEPARAVLFYRPEDLGLRRFFAGAGSVGVDEVAEVAEAIAEAAGPVQPDALRDETGLSETKLAVAVSRLEEVGALEVLPSGEVVSAGEPKGVALADAASAQDRHRAFERSRVEMMRGYAETRGCRREYVLSYFGEPFEPPCGRCDNCQEGLAPNDGPRPFAVGARVSHGEWGEGAVQRYDGDTMVVLFDEVGYKTLGIDLVRERGLLRLVSAG